MKNPLITRTDYFDDFGRPARKWRINWIEIFHRMAPRLVRAWLRWRNRRTKPWVSMWSYVYLPEYRDKKIAPAVGCTTCIRFVERQGK